MQLIPVRSSRLWCNALVPRNGGGWNLILQSYNFNDDVPSEWVVSHLDDGTFTVDSNTTRRMYGNANYCQIPNGNQVRCSNGRVFFPGYKNHIWVYDPTTERVTELPQIPSLIHANADSTIYKLVQSHDGKKLYGGTQGNINSGLPEVFELDSDTLVPRMLCRVGSGNHQLHGVPTYAYYMIVDGGKLYVLVGEDVWDCCVVDLATGVQTVLATRLAGSWMNFVVRAEGVTVRMYNQYQTANETLVEKWLVDGVFYDYVPGYDPATLPFAHRDVRPYSNPIVHPPQVDLSQGLGLIKWRPFGSTGDWTTNRYTVQYASGVNIESLVPLPDGRILGSVAQYLGDFIFDPVDGSITYLGVFVGVTEGTARCVVDGIVYMSGYFNAPLYKYDPALPWGTANPALIGYYSPTALEWSGVKHGTQLAYSALKHRMFMTGWRERTGVGCGIGDCDLATNTFGGHYAGLETFSRIHGLIVADSLGIVVASGVTSDGSEAQLVFHDLDLTEIERHTVIAGMTDTGRLFSTTDPNVVIGVVSTPGVETLYLYDLAARSLLGYVVPLGSIGASTQDADTLMVYVVIDGALFSVDALLRYTIASSDPALANASVIAVSKRKIFVANGPTLTVLEID